VPIHSRKSEARVRGSSGAQGPLRSFGESAGGIAKLIGGPIMAMELAMDRLHRELGQEAGCPELQVLREQNRRLASLVRLLVTFARPSRPRPRQVDVNRAVSVACSLEDPVRTGASHDLQLELDPELPLAQVDPHHLLEILLALLANARIAVERSPGPRWVRVSTGSTSEGSIRVRVQDSGAGVPPGEEERIFFPFVSGWNREGVGLSLSRLFLLLQQGELRLDGPGSKDGGAAFDLMLAPSHPEGGGGAKPTSPQKPR
jgi:C4-dicarboxylate-specific signal transduction histidine kinase